MLTTVEIMFSTFLIASFVLPGRSGWADLLMQLTIEHIFYYYALEDHGTDSNDHSCMDHWLPQLISARSTNLGLALFINVHLLLAFTKFLTWYLKGTLSLPPTLLSHLVNSCLSHYLWLYLCCISQIRIETCFSLVSMRWRCALILGKYFVQ